jgi:hypothetical protein
MAPAARSANAARSPPFARSISFRRSAVAVAPFPGRSVRRVVLKGRAVWNSLHLGDREAVPAVSGPLR